MVSLIHPSRKRPGKAEKTANTWISRAGQQVEHIISIDADDPTATLYEWADFCVVNTNTSVVEATNKAAKECSGDILVYLSDDFDCPENWVQSIIDVPKPSDIWLLKVDDCLQKFEIPVLTIPIMSRGLYEKLGYFWHPGYKSMFVDEDLYWTCVKLNCMINAPHLKFPHNHCSVGKAEHDETYRRSEANWNQGKQFFAQRKAQGFPL